MRSSLLVFGVCAAALSAGCGSVTHSGSAYDPVFGNTVRQASAQQVLNPQAGKDARAGRGDGQTAVLAIERHRGTYREPPPTFTILGLGAQGSNAR